MFLQARMRELEHARHLVVLRSDIHRRLIQLEGAVLCDRFGSLRPRQESVAAQRPLLIAGAGVAAVLAVRHWRVLARWGPSILAAWRAWRSFRNGK